MTPLEFIASLPHGEAKAAALTVYNLMTPVWTEITDDPATLPEMGRTVIIRDGDENFGYRDGKHPEGWCWYVSHLAYFSNALGTIEPECGHECTPTHWRLIG